MTPWRYEETKDYGDVINSTILKIFGDELTYNQLKPFTDEDEYTKLVVKTIINNERGFMFVTVWLDGKIILDRNYKVGASSVMLYYLEELDMDTLDEED